MSKSFSAYILHIKSDNMIISLTPWSCKAHLSRRRMRGWIVRQCINVCFEYCINFNTRINDLKFFLVFPLFFKSLHERNKPCNWTDVLQLSLGINISDKYYSKLQARVLIALKICFFFCILTWNFKINVVETKCVKSAKLVEIIPEIYRSGTTPRKRNNFALQLHLDDRTAVCTFIASLNYTSNFA